MQHSITTCWIALPKMVINNVSYKERCGKIDDPGSKQEYGGQHVKAQGERSKPL